MRLLSVSLCFLLLVAAPSLGATITVVNLDGPGEGFNDPTPRVPVGGNAGVTLGQQRLIAFEHAADIWGALLQSDVEIRVGANFDPLSCDAFGATLGGAGPETVHRDFANAPVAATWYPQALANSLAGVDLDAATNDIFATFNSVIGTTCPFPNVWYYGLDESPPGSDIDFASVVLHEIGHGLGFLTLVAQAGTKFTGFDDMYMLNLEDHSTGVSYPAMTNGERAAANIDDGDLHWTGASVVANGVSLSSGREPISGHVEIYAPNPFEGGSSVAHFSTSLSPNEAMEPFYTGPVHDPNLAADLMYDIGWLPNDCGNGLFDGAEECDDGDTVSGDGCSRCLIDECSSCVGEPSVCTPETGTACDDGQACTTSDLCQAGACVGAATPLTGCLVGTQAGTGLLLLKDKTSDQSDKLIWKFLKGEETTVGDFGNPPSGTDFLLCMYDKTGGQDTVVMSLEIPDGGDWDVKTTGFKYSDKAASSDGVKIALLKAGAAGKAKIIVKGKGVGLPMTDLAALDLPLTVQLSNGSQCWESTYQSNVQSSTAESFKAKAD